MTKRQRTAIATILLFTAFTALLNQTVMITALPVMAQTLHISLNMTQWLTAGYVLMIGLITPLSANLTEKFSSRQLFLGIIGLFIIGTIIGPLTNSFYIILLGRLLQAMAGGILTTFVMVSMLSIYPPHMRGTVMGFVSLVISAGPAVGPSLSGLVINYLSWKYLFYLVLVIMILSFIAGWLWLPNYSEGQDVKVDFKSAASSIIGMGLIFSSITVFGQNIGIALIMLIVGIVTTGYFLRRQAVLTNPLLNIKLFKRPNFALMIISTMLVFAILMGTEALIPIFIENILHRSSLLAGLVMLPGAVANAIMAPLVGRYYDVHGPKLPILSGLVLLILSSVPFQMMNNQTNVSWIIVVYIVRMIGISMVMSITTTESLKGLGNLEIGYGTAWNNTLRQISGSASNTILIVIVSVPASLMIGFHVAMTIIFGATFLLSLVCGLYLFKFYTSEG